MILSGLDITLAERDRFEDDTQASVYIKSKEGFLSRPKWDVNHWTWGYGTEAPHDGERDERPPWNLIITREEAQEELINYMETEVLNKLKTFAEKHNYNWTENQIDGLTSFIYNGKPNWLRQVTADGTRTNEEIAEAMLLYHNITDKDGNLIPVRSLIERRKEEVAIFLGEF